jgi:hypothetical protein
MEKTRVVVITIFTAGPLHVCVAFALVATNSGASPISQPVASSRRPRVRPRLPRKTHRPTG